MVARPADSGSQGVHSLGNQRASGLRSPWCPPLPRLWAKPTVLGNWPHPATWERFSAGEQALSSDVWAGHEHRGRRVPPTPAPCSGKAEASGFPGERASPITRCLL